MSQVEKAGYSRKKAYSVKEKGVFIIILVGLEQISYLQA